MRKTQKTLLVLTTLLMLVLVISAFPLGHASENASNRKRRVVAPRVFPTPDDTWVIYSDPYMWHAGDYIEGTRYLGAGPMRITHLIIHVELSYTSLWGIGHVDIDVYLNGNYVGSFVFEPGQVSKDLMFTGLSVYSPDGMVTIKYYETNTVASGYGSITICSVYSCVFFAAWAK